MIKITTKYVCDVCRKEKDKFDLFFVMAFPKKRAKKMGYKAELKKDICKECFKKIFGGK